MKKTDQVYKNPLQKMFISTDEERPLFLFRFF